MSEYATLSGADTLRIERVLPGPIERVWAYLTESEKRGRWFASGDMELRIGGAVELRFKHSELSAEKTYPEKYKGLENGHVAHGRITQCDPPRRLSYTWDEEPMGGSEVTFELTPRGNDVLLVLTHRRIAKRADLIGAAGGWHSHLAILEDRLNDHEPRGFWSMHTKVAAEYERRFGA
jgi:uncharacterized protein YndB with AHSA1/START domain